METPVIVAPPVRPATRHEIAVWTAVVALVGAMVARWWPAWSAAPEQAYGWIVPLLALGLGWERWACRPNPHAPMRTAFAWTLCLAGLVVLPALLTILTANPLWPLAQWLTVGIALTAALAGVVAWAGWAYARHFAFAIAFVATALTWPTAVTNWLIPRLTGFNAELAAAAVSALGHPAVVRGAVIELANGFVGVDEACSGVRSLQTVWMVGWFLGEFFGLNVIRRVRLVVVGLLIAMLTNWLRTTALTWIAAVHGVTASAQWHDRVGAVELVVTLLLVVLVAWRTRRSEQGQPPPVPCGAAIDAGARANGRTVAWVLAVGALAAIAVPEAWYHWHEVRFRAKPVAWDLVRPDAAWQNIELSPRLREILKASAATGFTHPSGRRPWYAYLVRWNDDVERATAAELHDPTICLPASGVAFVPTSTRATVTIDGTLLEFSVGRCLVDGAMTWVFYAHWDGWLGRSRETVGSGMTRVPAWRLERVRVGRRSGDAAYMVLLTDAATEVEARQWLAKWAPRLLAVK